MKTAVLIILDGMGVGDAPDAEAYGDVGTNTFVNMSRVTGGVNIPTLESLVIGNIAPIEAVDKVSNPRASYGRLEEISMGKDSTTGHWELMGVVTEKAFPTYPDGFPEDVLAEFTARTGYGVIGNKAASGTEIIKELGEAHLNSGKLIVYTSADSVFQIAAHDSVCSLEELYRVCEISRELLAGEHNVSRVIARPFTGAIGHFERTPYRKDYSVSPPTSLLLNQLTDSGVQVESIGKIYDLYNGMGIDKSYVSKSNAEGMDMLMSVYNQPAEQDRLLLLNLVDFDMLWGHRNDPHGMKQGLEIFDQWLAGFLEQMREGDTVYMTADHGNDPTGISTDHSREHVPIIVYTQGQEHGANLGVRKGFMDVGASLADYFSIRYQGPGKSFYTELNQVH
ncbi:MAG: phosphopentomutase [Gammaproteobacteria bacterium]